MNLCHLVECGTSLEPFDLAFIEGVVELDIEFVAVLGMYPHGDGVSNAELSRKEIDTVIGFDLVVVGGIGECEGQHSLLLQVGFVLDDMLANRLVAESWHYSRYVRSFE